MDETHEPQDPQRDVGILVEVVDGKDEQPAIKKLFRYVIDDRIEFLSQCSPAFGGLNDLCREGMRGDMDGAFFRVPIPD